MYNTLFLQLLVVISMGKVYPRHVLEKNNDPDHLTHDQNYGIRKHSSDQNNWRRSWHTDYGAYNYLFPPRQYYPERREHDRNQHDLLLQIVKLLEEIATYVKRPQLLPMMPQPIYIPYSVPYPAPECSVYKFMEDTGQSWGIINKENETDDERPMMRPETHSRFSEEDTNTNWGFVINEEDKTDDLGDSRPISFDPIKLIGPMMRPPPKVEHNSSSDIQTTAAPKYNEQPGALRTQTMCNGAILSCCADEKPQQKMCFNGLGCGVTYDNGNACSDYSINSALESFKSTYSPVQ